MVQVRDGAGSSGEKWFDLVYILEIEYTTLLRGMRERKREVKGDSKVWDLHNWISGAPFIGKAAKGTGWRSQVREDGMGRTTEGVRVQMTEEGTSSRKRSLRNIGVGRLPLVRDVAKGEAQLS